MTADSPQSRAPPADSLLGQVYLNGDFVEPSAARVSVLDRGYLLGDGVFDTLRSYGKRLFAAREHVGRLRHSASVARIPLPLTDEELLAVLQESVERAKVDDVYVRITLTRGVGGAGIGTSTAGAPTLSIVARPLPRYAASAHRDGIASMVLSKRRVPACCLDTSIKSIGYLPTILARRELEEHGLSEGIQLSPSGDVVSGSVSNLFAVQGGRIVTPALACGALPGVTRAVVLRVAKELGFDVSEAAFDVSQLREADELFFTNTIMELLPIQSVATIREARAPGPMFRRLSAAFTEFVNRAGVV